MTAALGWLGICAASALAVVCLAKWDSADEAELARWNGIMTERQCAREDRRVARRLRLRRVWLGLTLALRAATGRRWK